MMGRWAPALLAVVVAAFVFGSACDSGDSAGSTSTTGGPPSVEDRSGELLGQWDVVNYVLPGGGGLTNVVGEAPVFIEFRADGIVAYHTGCNSGGTTYTTSGTYYVPESGFDEIAEGQSITLGPLFEQTEQGCEGFLGDQDRDLPANMGAATRFTLDGTHLRLHAEFLLIETMRSP